MILCENLKTMFEEKKYQLPKQVFAYIMYVKSSTIQIDNEVMSVKKGEQFYITYDSKKKTFNVYQGVFSLGKIEHIDISPVFSFTATAAKGANNKRINQFMSQFSYSHENLFCSIYFEKAAWCEQFTEHTRKMRPVKTTKKIKLGKDAVVLILQVKDLSRLKSLVETYENLMENEMDIRIPTFTANQQVDSGFLIDIDLAEYSIFAE